MILIDLGWLGFTLAALAAFVAVAAGTIWGFDWLVRRWKRRRSDDLMAICDATREMPAGPCGCKWFDPYGEPVYEPCAAHDYSRVAPDFEAWEQEYNRYHGISP